MTSLVQIDEERVRLSAAGLFKVGVHLIPAVSIIQTHFLALHNSALSVWKLAGAVVTYMVILLQS